MVGGTDFEGSDRAVREGSTALGTMGLVENVDRITGSDGRVKQIEVVCDPQWVRDPQAQYVAGQSEE
jgi:hypothetical protein